jgi:hypothetical protein
MNMLHPSRFAGVLLLVLAGLLPSRPVAAGDFRSAKVRWCVTEDPTVPGTARFLLELAERRFANQQVGDIHMEYFNFGDGSSVQAPLTVVEVHETAGWFLARGRVTHRYQYPLPSSTARFEGCCRIDGENGNDFLNNRSGDQFSVRAAVNTFAEGECSPDVDLPPIVWLSGGLGDTFTIPIPVSHSRPIQCRFATDAEAGGPNGGPNPDGMTIDADTCAITWTPTPGDPNAFWTTQVRVEEVERLPRLSTAVDFLLGLDAAPPVCRLSVSSGSPVQLRLAFQDSKSGLSRIEVLAARNVNVFIPPFTPGETGELVGSGTKIDQSQPGWLTIRATDVAGNEIDCDPVITQVIRATGRPEVQTYTGVPSTERAVTIFNGDPGLKQVQIDVNGRKFNVSGLQDGEKRTIDVGAAIVPGVDSTFKLTAHGKPGGTAEIVFWDGNSR